ncbi:MAG TPA: hypothetical protein VEW48_01335 [Thermoanaerobaculia bacterium]|nr:hypothetical protein [Thermoanaerobaculia bacterium]
MLDEITSRHTLYAAFDRVRENAGPAPFRHLRAPIPPSPGRGECVWERGLGGEGLELRHVE